MKKAGQVMSTVHILRCMACQAASLSCVLVRWNLALHCKDGLTDFKIPSNRCTYFWGNAGNWVGFGHDASFRHCVKISSSVKEVLYCPCVSLFFPPIGGDATDGCVSGESKCKYFIYLWRCEVVNTSWQSYQVDPLCNTAFFSCSDISYVLLVSWYIDYPLESL